MAQKYYKEWINSELENEQAINRVSELVQKRLVECGWSDQVRLVCRKLSDEDRFRTFDELAAVVTPTARAMVPDSVKRELLHEIELMLKNVDRQPPKKSV